MRQQQVRQQLGDVAEVKLVGSRQAVEPLDEQVASLEQIQVALLRRGFLKAGGGVAGRPGRVHEGDRRWGV